MWDSGWGVGKQKASVPRRVETTRDGCQEWAMRTVWLSRKRGKAPRRRFLSRRLRVGKTLSNARVSCVARVEDSLHASLHAYGIFLTPRSMTVTPAERLLGLGAAVT